jgi:protein-tyrosine kinase
MDKEPLERPANSFNAPYPGHLFLTKNAEGWSVYKEGVGEAEPPVVMAAAGPVPATPAAKAPSVALETVLEQCLQTKWLPDTKTMLFFGPEEEVEGTEQFRTLRSQLYQLREKESLRMILVVSAVPGEGRSFVAANLAQAMARQPGCRALLIDADLRNPNLHVSLGTPATPGLGEYLLGETDELGIIQRGQMENLFFIASGRHLSGQTEILCNGRLKLLLDHLEGIYDWIILDSPAAMPVSDAALISNFCDGVLMVVRSSSTPFDVVRKAQQKFSDEKLLGVVLNGSPAEIDPQVRHYHSASRPGVSRPGSSTKEVA